MMPKQITYFVKNIARAVLSNELDVLKTKNILLDGKNIMLTQKNLEISKELKELKSDILSEQNANSLRDYWNSRWKTSPIKYQAQGEYYRDVRGLINYPSYLADDIVRKYNLKKDTENDTILAIIKWCATKIKYAFDEPHWGKKEYWADSDIILQEKIDDCDGKAVALKALSLAAGIPDWKVAIVAGWVQDPNDRTKKIGHAYPVFRFDENEYPIDPTYYPDWSTPLLKRKTLKTDKRYNPVDKSIWWHFTKNNSYAKRATRI